MNHRRVLLLVNPNSRKGAELVEEVRNLLTARGVEIVHVQDGGPKHFARAIREYSSRVDLVAVGGGDGSMNAALPTLMEMKLPLAVLPLGTANNLARSVGVPLDLEQACDVLREGELRAVDLGWVNGHYFFNVAGIGVSNQVNQEVPAESKRRWGTLAYMATAYRVMRHFRPFWAEVKSPDHPAVRLRSLQISLVNGKHFGSGMVAANDAAIDDGEMDLCSVEVKRWRDLPRIVARMKGVESDGPPPILHLRDREFTVKTRHPMPVDTDGEITTMTPAHFRVYPKAFQILAPRAIPTMAGAEERSVAGLRTERQRGEAPSSESAGS